MNPCCASANGRDGQPQRPACPANGRVYPEVSARTIVHHIAEPWNWQQTARRYFFCADPSCEIVYFGDDGSTILKSQLRPRLGLKEASDEALLCYCFGVTRRDFRQNPATRDFVVAQTRAGQCSCETSNPSGRCCLKELPAPERE